MYSQYEVMRMALYLYVPPPKSYNPSPTMRKMPGRQIPLKGHSIKYLTSTSKNCQDHPKQGKSEKLS